MIFECIKSSSTTIILNIRTFMLESRNFRGKMGYMNNTVENLLILKNLQLEGRGARKKRSYLGALVSAASWVVKIKQ